LLYVLVSFFIWGKKKKLDWKYVLGGLFAAEIQTLREPFDDYIDEKHYHNDFLYSPSNGSHLQLTNGRGRSSQSEL